MGVSISCRRLRFALFWWSCARTPQRLRTIVSPYTTMRRSAVRVLVAVMAMLAVSAALVLDRTLNKASGTGKSDPAPLIVLDDFHGEQLSLFFVHGYGPSQYGGGFTCVEWPQGNVLYKIPLSIYSVFVVLGGLVALALSIGGRFFSRG